MRRASLILLAAATLAACGEDNPVEPAIPLDLAASLQATPDLSGLLPNLERRVFIHYRRGFERPEGRGRPGGGGPSECYSLLGKGASWKSPEPYRTTFSLPVDTWEFANEIFGPVQGGPVPQFTGDLDGINTAQFGPYPDPNVIAVTVVWGIFAGPPSQRELVEWDLLMNSAFDFGNADRDASVMDIENIAAHELGHAAGLGHPASSCTEETMFAYADYGETKKRTLEDGDRAGILALY